MGNPSESSKRYVAQYDRWREVARSLPQDIDVDAARDAFRAEANQRDAARSNSERRADS